MTTVLVTSQEKVPIYPLLGSDPLVPDEVAVVKRNTDVTTLTDADFTAPTTIDDQTAVWVKDLTPGDYIVVCRMDLQGDGQRPVWQLTGLINVKGILRP